ncbi:hypothetical protein [Pediococcus claussenii]|uniref:DNA-directed RNA polymerase beta subunit n=1 Tax=Pediococcus claussenii (strain ATCC BAA-344 / DSM 14800 / JCM 18046 / KCTC 3811 / LMG 21948 / P06) TaxID=701521 RepID=G8PB92_PEDCP|nr:hypothetical protein [Pediococcus claussenii]AEV94721.1 hypothetical protein PECL_417 [Pediococcus claussenii ATCC BAA-344]ANZ69916.1 hypothetical protein AYR57_06150 [Pediococcus claussenii]ANZ71733.1 hypothetical protein AYR58_06155 [Pediococcus claussenii]KRN20900.1 hypothetical protein IV79_GL000125 [Pediococcus claussenii]
MNNQDYQFDPKIVERFLTDYQDRGMVKWQGFYLSDHTQRIERDAKVERKRAERIKKPPMERGEVLEFIQEAFQKGLRVAIQMNWSDRNQHIPDLIVGLIEGQYQGRIVVNGKLIMIEDIYFIKNGSEV